jgi:hypothetical protein
MRFWGRKQAGFCSLFCSLGDSIMGQIKQGRRKRTPMNTLSQISLFTNMPTDGGSGGRRTPTDGGSGGRRMPTDGGSGGR